jgi:hypothetical protein
MTLNWIYWIFLITDALAALAAVVFFIIGLVDGSVADFNIGLWFGSLACIGGIIYGGVALAQGGMLVWAIVLLGVLAVPSLMYGLFLLLAVILQPDWR